MIRIYKGRTVDWTKPVEVYRCLNRKGKMFSIRQEGYVVGHSQHIGLSDCSFIINQSGKKRCMTTGERNVHAFIRGMLTGGLEQTPSFERVSYYPYGEAGFTRHTTERKGVGTVLFRVEVPIHEAAEVIISPDGVFAKTNNN